MAIQFAGSNSTDNRRRRRIVVHGEGSRIDAAVIEGDGAEIESQLVASAAAGPWVPVKESRIWIYAGVIGVFLAAITFVWAQPQAMHDSVAPLTRQLFAGSKPVLLTCVEFLFLALAAQLSYLIGWYRSRGKLDFGGRYRFWPWATALFALAAVGTATESHRALGQVIDNTDLLTWREATVAWLLPVCLLALPIALFLDRDIRHSRSSLWTVRLSVGLWVAEAWLELFRPEFDDSAWYGATHLLIPLFASATLFVGLWLHARIVAYVCPDPPELDERSAWAQLASAGRYMLGLMMFWKRAKPAEDDEKPKRRKKKTETAEEPAAKRKRKLPAKRATSPRTRTRTKVAEEEEAAEEVEEQLDSSTSDEVDSYEGSTSDSTSSWDENETQQPEEQWEDAAEEEEAVEEPPRKGNGRQNQVHKAHGSPGSGPHSRRKNSSWEEESEAEESESQVSNQASGGDDDDEDGRESEANSDQFKGLSKRQKRELKRQLRDQERSRDR